MGGRFVSFISRKIKQVRLARNRAWFEKTVQQPESGIGQMVAERAQAMAMQMVTNWLDRKRIRHCTYCPGTEQLRSVSGSYLCPGHFELVEKEADKRTTAALAH